MSALFVGYNIYVLRPATQASTQASTQARTQALSRVWWTVPSRGVQSFMVTRKNEPNNLRRL